MKKIILNYVVLILMALFLVLYLTIYFSVILSLKMHMNTLIWIKS